MIENPFDQFRNIRGDTGRIWFRILLTSFCKNDAQTPLP